MGTSLGLAVARRALLLALVALLVGVVALVAALVADPGRDDAADGVDLAAAQTAAAQAGSEEAAVAAAASAVKADEAAVAAREAVAMAQLAAAQAAAAAEALAPATVGAEGGTPVASGGAGETGATPATGRAAGASDSQDAGSGESETAATAGASGPSVALPGEPYQVGPPAGAALAVVGVSHDGTLNVRDVPAGEVVARLDSVLNAGSEPVVYVREAESDELIATLDLRGGVIATGSTRKLPTTVWHEIRMADTTGWASRAYLSPLGATSDTTAEIVAALGETPSAPTLAELARIVAEAVSSEDPPSRIVVSGAPTAGNAAEIAVDVLGLPDDSVRGLRLRVFAHQDSDSDPFTLKAVESTAICYSHRGVSEAGRCN